MFSIRSAGGGRVGESPRDRLFHPLLNESAKELEEGIALHAAWGHWFGADPQFWLNLQSAYEIWIAAEKAGREIARLPVRTGVTRPGALGIA